MTNIKLWNIKFGNRTEMSSLNVPSHSTYLFHAGLGSRARTEGGRGRKRAWYTLTAHAQVFHRNHSTYKCVIQMMSLIHNVSSVPSGSSASLKKTDLEG